LIRVGVSVSFWLLLFIRRTMSVCVWLMLNIRLVLFYKNNIG